MAAQGNYLVSSNLGSSVLMLSSGTIGYVENQIADILGAIQRCSFLVGNEAITHNRLRKGRMQDCGFSNPLQPSVGHDADRCAAGRS